MKTEAQSIAYLAGYNAYENGDPENDNPHEDTADLSEAWLEGYGDAEHDAAEDD